MNNVSKNVWLLSRYKVFEIYLLFFYFFVFICLFKLNLNRVFGIPIIYLPAFLLAGFTFLKPVVYKSQKNLLILLSTFYFVSFVSSINSIISLKNFILFSFMNFINFLIFFSANRLESRQIVRLKIILINIFFVSTVLSLFYFSLGFLPVPNILESIGINRNSFVFFICVIFNFQLVELLKNKSVLNIIKTLFFLLTIIFIGSRSAYIAITISSFLFFKQKKKNKNKKIKLKSIFIFILIITSLISLNHLSSIFSNRLVNMGEIIQIFGAKKLTRSDTGGRRQILMLTHLSIFFENKWFGIGVGQSLPYLKNKFDDIGTSIGSSHNTQIRILAENGLIGFSLLTFFYLILLRKLSLKTKNGDLDANGFYCAYIALLVLSIGNEYFFTNPFIWFCLSLFVNFYPEQINTTKQNYLPQ